MSRVTQARSRLALSVKHSKKPDATPAAVEAVREARRLLAEAKLEACVAKILSESPDLTAGLKAKLAEILTGGVR